jgi:hypothetical protein
VEELPEQEKKLAASIVDLYIHTLKYVLGMIEVVSGNSPRRGFHAFVDSSEVWKEHIKQILSKDAMCNINKNECDAERKFQVQNRDILEWITPLNALRQHEISLQVKGVDGLYAACGQWLLDQIHTENFLTCSDWQNSVLWLSGTSK